MGAVAAKMFFKTGKETLAASQYSSLNRIPEKELLSTRTRYSEIQELVGGKKLYLIVNVASK